MTYKNVSGVYCILNVVNQKRYIGSSTKSIRRRLHSHRVQLLSKSHYNSYLQKSWNKYGVRKFRFITLLECLPGECITNEQFFIDKYDSANRDRGYNLSPTAGNTFGIKFSEESKLKISTSKSGKKMPVGFGAKISLAQKGRSKSTEHRLKISMALKGLSKSPEHKAKLSKSLTGKTLSVETKKKLSIAQQNRKRSPLSVETKKKISMSLIANHALNYLERTHDGKFRCLSRNYRKIKNLV